MCPANVAPPHWMSRLMTPRPPSRRPSPSRIEVCPPELWPSSLGWRGSLRRWLQRSAFEQTPQKPVNRLATVKQEFREASDDVPASLLHGLDERIEGARSLRELWHLRSPLYSAVAIGLNQSEADRRLLHLNRHFPTRAPGAAGAISVA